MAIDFQSGTLTSLPGSGYWQHRLAEECGRARRHVREFSVILLDIVGSDGPQGPDAAPAAGVMAAVAASLQRCLRSSDVVCRLTLNRFGILLVETDPTGSKTFLQRLQRLIQRDVAHQLSSAALPYVRAGLASYGVDGATPQELLHAAAANLLRRAEGTATEEECSGAATNEGAVDECPRQAPREELRREEIEGCPIGGIPLSLAVQQPAAAGSEALTHDGTSDKAGRNHEMQLRESVHPSSEVGHRLSLLADQLWEVAETVVAMEERQRERDETVQMVLSQFATLSQRLKTVLTSEAEGKLGEEQSSTAA